MLTKSKKWKAWALFAFYLFLVVEIILVKHPRFFLWRMSETFYRHHFEWIGLHANFKPFATIRHMLFADFRLKIVLLNIVGNVLLFVPMGIFLTMYFKPPKIFKVFISCFALSALFEIFQLLTACGFFDIDDIFLNTLGGITGIYIYSRFMKHSTYSKKKWIAAYAPN